MEISERVSAGPLHPSLTSASASPAANQQPGAAAAAASALSPLSFGLILPFTFNNFLKLTPLSHPPPSPAPGGLMEIRLYSPGPPTSAFRGDMRGAGGRTYRFICGTVRGTGRPFKRYLFQLCTVDIKAGAAAAAAAAAELFGKRSQCRLRSLARALAAFSQFAQPRRFNFRRRGGGESQRRGNMSHFQNVPSRPSARSL